MTDIKPYIELNEKLDVIMCAHILFSEVDKNIPSFSQTWIKDVLRNKINYKGLILSDDLSMLGSGKKVLAKRQKCHLMLDAIW